MRSSRASWRALGRVDVEKFESCLAYARVLGGINSVSGYPGLVDTHIPYRMTDFPQIVGRNKRVIARPLRTSPLSVLVVSRNTHYEYSTCVESRAKS